MNFKYVKSLTKAFVGISLSAFALIPLSLGAVQLRDGKTYFVQLPMLMGAETTRNSIYVSGATYYFDIALPANMGEPLQKIEISQAEGFETIGFIRDRTVTYLQTGTGRLEISSSTEITLKEGRDRPTISVSFDAPIPADSQGKLIIGLRPVHNPRYDGVYLFGVTASPQGDRPNSQFLGYGRLSFYSSFD
ncbi:MAG: hypothetical protein AUK48_06295 [Oscillatoriales cyanobacterium CG2_30_44_21]|nr:MAG: hypothetical protein AUK48_06295 [Oscillatoriales cyanobacterium CG2_30_44_21]